MSQKVSIPGRTITISQGTLVGKRLKDLNEKNVDAFLGIPYAKPPLGSLRFKAPQPAEKWEGEFQATTDGNECYARDPTTKDAVGSEDCLFLNVFSPSSVFDPGSALNVGKPVMVWIHGGAFLFGCNSSTEFGPKYLATKDVILVTLNYRLGILGFLSFEDNSLNIPGNAALKDLVLALKWVQENIKSFGGDPNNVTIFGNSTGGSLVHYLVLSPVTKGLFHKAIMQSGTAINSFATGRNITAELAKQLGMDENEKAIRDHLLTLPIKELFQLSEDIVRIAGDLFSPFAPVVEKPDGDEAFITEAPLVIINSGKYHHIPLIFGYTTGEGMLIEFFDFKDGILKNLELAVPRVLGLTVGTEACADVAEKMREFYFPEPGMMENSVEVYKFFTDNIILKDVITAATHHAKTSTMPVFLYRMSLETSLNFFKRVIKVSCPGVCHGDELQYIFGSELSPTLKPGSIEEVSVKRFQALWTSFAKYGNVNADGDEVVDRTWRPLTKTEIYFMDIGDALCPGEFPEYERLAFWKDIFAHIPEYNI